MAIIQRLLSRVAVIAALALSVSPMSAQNVMHLRIDTVTANPGATVDVRVLYTFDSTHAHDINDFLARFLFDTSKSHLAAYILSGTAFAAFAAPGVTMLDSLNPNSGSLVSTHDGIFLNEFLNPQIPEIDLADSVLLKIRMTLDSSLDTVNGDTAWVRWDPKWTLAVSQTFQGGKEGVDSLYHEDGWIRVPQSPMSVVDRTNANELLRLYPNPARDEVTIDVPGYSKRAELEVYDAVGRLVFSGPFLGAWSIPAEFEAGAYEIVLNDADRMARFIGTLIVASR
jgi:hypothetical protein